MPPGPGLDVGRVVAEEMESVRGQVRSGQRIAIAVGSRGITGLQAIVRLVVERLKDFGAQPFIVPAMGSHGGASPEGQTELLAGFGISERELGVSIRAAMEVDCIGKTQDGVAVWLSTEARQADGIVLVNRIKPHTDFEGDVGSGLLKMLVVGLGKHVGAAKYHRASSRWGYEHVLRTSARVILTQAPVLGGLAIVEDQAHRTARIAYCPAAEMESREEILFEDAKRLLPRLPFDEVHLLIVDRMGKNISGTGMDSNVIGRTVHGYSTLHGEGLGRPWIRRLFVRELTPESRGNATGIGMADFTTARLVQSVDRRVTALNALTALTVQGAKIPIHFETDREVIAAALESTGVEDWAQAGVVRILDTLSLERLEISESFLNAAKGRDDLEILSSPEEMRFDGVGNLAAQHFAGAGGGLY